MGITGTFRTTRFSDLLRYYATSKESATIRVRLDPSSADPDGVFRFVRGELVEASLEGARGREALRRALALRDGSFSEDPRDEEILESAFRALPDDEFASAATSSPRASSSAPFVVSLGHGTATPAIGGFGRPAPAAARPVASGGTAPALAVASSTEPMPVAQPLTNPAPDVVVPVPPREVSSVTPLATSTQAPVPARASASSPGEAPANEAPEEADDTAPSEREGRGGEPPGGRGPRLSRTVLLAVGGAVVVLGAVAAILFFVSEKGPAGPRAGPGAAGQGARAAARGVLPDSVVLGMVSSFTGSNRERGRAMRAGWETAIAEVNETGGIHGRKLRLVAQDDGYDPARTLAGMKAVVEDGSAFAIVGNVGTETAAVAAPYAAQHEAVFFGALSGSDLLRKTPPDRHVFNFRASLAREAELAVKYLVTVRRLSARRIAVLAQNDNFGASGKRGALRQLEAFGVPAADVLQLAYPRNTADVNDALAQVRAHRKDLDAVVMVATYKPAATFVRKAKDAGLDLFYTTVSADSSGLAEELVESGAEYTRNVLLTQVVPVPTSYATTLVRYRQALERYAPGEKPSSTSLEAWIGAQIFLEGLRRAGRDLDTPKLVTALEAIRDWDIGIGASITFGPDDHQGCDVVWGWMLQPDGTYKQVDLE